MAAFWNDPTDRLKSRESEGVTKMQVILHEGGPEKSNRKSQLAWVRVTERKDGLFRGVILEKPSHLRTFRKGSEISFLMPKGGQHALQVSSKYLDERSSWRLLMPCNRCGLSELFDPPSELLAAIFPTSTAEDLAKGFTFTTTCGWCDGGLVVRIKRTDWPWSDHREQNK